jgi:hypothetical protein
MKLNTPKPSDFDPYYRWLGIPRGQRPPNHYRLLGISPKEEDNDLIKAAVERQTLLVKDQKEPEQEQLATRLLYEIQEAGMVILDPYRRKQYDAFLEQSKPPEKQRSNPEPFPPCTPSKAVGEGNEIVRTYFGVMSIILGGFVIMAVVSLILPWRTFLSNRPEREEAQNRPIVQPANAQQANFGQAQPVQIAAAHAAKAAAPRGAAQERDRNADEAESATIEATITAVDVPGRSITVSRKSKTVALDVSRIAKIMIDGAESALDALRPGLAAMIEFDPKLDVATKIEVASLDGKIAPSERKAATTTDGAPQQNGAALTTLEMTLQQIDAEGRKLTVTRNSKSTTFDVSRKAMIVVGGKSTTLDTLRPNQKAAITFDPENEVCVRVEVAGPTNESAIAPTTATPGTAAPDELTTVEATIVSVDDSKRSVSITRKSKTTEFDVSRKAEIVVNDKAATLDALKPGQNATITINTQADVVVKIEVTATGLSNEAQK